ncbi:MAG: hypothetical protein KatS3mg023_3969 [Armatimonadota bacterium]|nr:MAG: hypothetical protein KatS3mg023_3969 [Armatimonadota bacterium]
MRQRKATPLRLNDSLELVHGCTRSLHRSVGCAASGTFVAANNVPQFENVRRAARCLHSSTMFLNLLLEAILFEQMRRFQVESGGNVHFRNSQFAYSKRARRIYLRHEHCTDSMRAKVPDDNLSLPERVCRIKEHPACLSVFTEWAHGCSRGVRAGGAQIPRLHGRAAQHR